MMSEIPINLENLEGQDLDQEILRVGIIAELDAINLYEQMAEMTDDDKIKEVMLDVAKEEKTHMGEFETLLLDADQQQAEESKKGEEEVEANLVSNRLERIVAQALREALADNKYDASLQELMNRFHEEVGKAQDIIFAIEEQITTESFKDSMVQEIQDAEDALGEARRYVFDFEDGLS